MYRTLAGKWLQTAPWHVDLFMWILLEEGGKRKQVGTFNDSWLSWCFPHRSALLGPWHPFLLRGAYGTVCPRGSAAAKDHLLCWKSMEVLLQSCRARILPGACSHTSVERTHCPVMGRPSSLQLFWSPAGWLCIHKWEDLNMLLWSWVKF